MVLWKASKSATSKPARGLERAKVVINATGAFTDHVRRLADDIIAPMMSPSQGIHLVFDRSFLAWRQRHHGAPHQRRPRNVRHSLARPHARRHHRHANPGGFSGASAVAEQEIDFILKTAWQYLQKLRRAATS